MLSASQHSVHSQLTYRQQIDGMAAETRHKNQRSRTSNQKLPPHAPTHTTKLSHLCVCPRSFLVFWRELCLSLVLDSPETEQGDESAPDGSFFPVWLGS